MDYSYRGITAECRHNPYLDSALRDLDGFATAIAVREDAVRRLDALHNTAPEVTATAPMVAGKITDAWLKQAAAARALDRDLQVQREILTQVRSLAEADVPAILEIGADDVFGRLNDDLAELMADASDAALTLDGARTATEAISKGAHAAWAALTDLAVQYDQIRSAQRTLITHWPEQIQISRTQYQDDEHASDLYLSNLDDIWPTWRRLDAYNMASGQLTANTPPWPSEPVERLAWLSTSDANVWVPTLDQLEALRAQRNAIPARQGRPGDLRVATDHINEELSPEQAISKRRKKTVMIGGI